jgi:hypothetical protein
MATARYRHRDWSGRRQRPAVAQVKRRVRNDGDLIDLNRPCRVEHDVRADQHPTRRNEEAAAEGRTAHAVDAHDVAAELSGLDAGPHRMWRGSDGGLLLFQASVTFRLAAPPPSTNSPVSLPLLAVNDSPNSMLASLGRTFFQAPAAA